VLDTTVVNVSLPHIAATMSRRIDEGRSWVPHVVFVGERRSSMPMTGGSRRPSPPKRLLMMSGRPASPSPFVSLRIGAELSSTDRVSESCSGATAARCSRCRRPLLLESFGAALPRKAIGLLGPRHVGRADHRPGDPGGLG